MSETGSSVNGKKVTAATLHENIFYPSIGEIKKELTTVHNGVNQSMESMTLDEPFLLVKIKNKTNKVVTMPIPITNFKYLVLAD